MRKYKSPLFIFFLILTLIFAISLCKSDRSKAVLFINSEDQIHNLFVNSSINETTYYVQLDYENLDFRISVNHWGDNLGGLYQGLIVALVFDSNNTELDSWLILHGDSSEHYFFTENSFSGILRIVFTCINVNIIGYDLIINNQFPIWTYELVCSPEIDVHFGLERSDYSVDVFQLVLDFEKNFSNDSQFVLGIYDEVNYTEEYIETTMEYYPENKMILKAYVTLDYWYRLNFEIEEYNSSEWIAFKLYYDHISTELIIRLFLNHAEKEIFEIPIDLVHSSYLYNWFIDYYDYHDFFPDWVGTLLITLKWVIIGITVSAIPFAFIRGAMKRKRNKNNSDLSPSYKYQYANEKIAYNPKPTHNINFENIPNNYNLRTTDGSKITCSICMQIIEDHSTIIRCPSCDIAYHKNHLYQWIVGNGTCPACKSRLRITSN